MFWFWLYMVSAHYPSLIVREELPPFWNLRLYNYLSVLYCIVPDFLRCVSSNTFADFSVLGGNDRYGITSGLSQIGGHQIVDGGFPWSYHDSFHFMANISPKMSKEKGRGRALDYWPSTFIVSTPLRSLG